MRGPLIPEAWKRARRRRRRYVAAALVVVAAAVAAVLGLTQRGATPDRQATHETLEVRVPIAGRNSVVTTRVSLPSTRSSSVSTLALPRSVGGRKVQYTCVRSGRPPHTVCTALVDGP